MAFLFRLYIISYQGVIEADGVWYVILGQNLLSGRGYVNQMGEVELAYPPLYPIFTGLMSLLTRDGEMAGRLVSALAGALLILPIFYFAREVYGKRAAHMAALTALLYPTLSFFSSMVMSEATYTLFFFSGIYAGWLAISGGKLRHYLLTGGFFGLATLTRPEGALFFAIFFFYLVLEKRLALLNRRVILGAASAILLFMMIIFPFVRFVHRETGRWSLGNKREGIAFISKSIVNEPYGYEKAHFAPSQDGSTLKLYTKQGQATFRDYITSNPAGVWRYYRSNIYNFYKKDLIRMVPAILIPFLGIGLLLPRWNRPRFKRESYLLLYLIPPLFIYPLFLTHFRRYVPFVPLGILWIGGGMNLVWEEMAGLKVDNSSSIGRSFSRLGIPVLLLAVVMSLTAWETVREKPFIDPDFRRMGLWMSENLTEGGTVMGRQPWVAYYAGMKFIPFPYSEDPREVFRYAWKHQVDYIVVDYNLLSARNHLGYIRDWYRISVFPKEMEPIADLKKPWKNIVLYRLFPEREVGSEEGPQPPGGLEGGGP